MDPAESAIQRNDEGHGVPVFAGWWRRAIGAGDGCGWKVAGELSVLPSAVGKPDGGECRDGGVCVESAVGAEREHAGGEAECRLAGVWRSDGDGGRVGVYRRDEGSQVQGV